MLDDDLKAQLKAYLERITQPIELVASLDSSDASREMLALLNDVAAQSTNVVVVEEHGGEARKPSFLIQRVSNRDIGVRFAGLPMGHEFTSLVLALLQVGGYAPKLDASVVEQIRSLDGDFRFETYVSLTCQNCPDVVQALNAMSVINPRIQHVTIDGALFQHEVEQRKIMA
ncbi:MAG TPA: alkyl hydroperoxide reductase subunit F, partial [Burkholderiaceae bacterium]